MWHAHPLPRHACPPWQAYPRHAHTPGGYYEMRSMSGRYTSYWNAFLYELQPIRNIEVVHVAGNRVQMFYRRITVLNS